MKKIEIKANAKINLFLDISALRKDGYHDILSIMQSVSLCDTVNIEYEESSEKKIEVKCDTQSLPADSRNLAYKAADRLLDSGTVKIEIKKNIFLSAGLAGGSADAAAVLVGLARLSKPDINTERLFKIGAEIGADVPFCMVGGTKLVTGIGDIHRNFAEMPETHLVIACMGEGFPTPEAYKRLDRVYNNFENYKPETHTIDYIKDCFSRKLLPDRSFNIFESAVLPMRPHAEKIKKVMCECGARLALMSGSGPSVFGIFGDYESALEAVKELTQTGASAKLCEPRKSGLEIL